MGSEEALSGASVEDEEEEEEITAASLRGQQRLPPISAMSAFSYVPLRRQDPKEYSYFYQEAKMGILSLYDCAFKSPLDYNQRSHRDDREHAKGQGLHVNEEERARPVGALTSSAYGRHVQQPLEPRSREHGRASRVQADFYRKNGVPGSRSPGFGHVPPA
ncbi:cilia- and flagella-associated protein 90 [Rhynchocyon petersi]